MVSLNPTAIGLKDPSDSSKRKWRIPVCGDSRYKTELTAAVNVWNRGAGVPIFEVLNASPAVTYDGMGKIDTVTSAGCPATAEPESGEEKYVASVVVLKKAWSTVLSGYNNDPDRGPVGHWGYSWARWVRAGTVMGSGSGEQAAAEPAALGDARSKAAGSLSGISYSTSKITGTVVTVTATAGYTWLQYRGQEAAAQSGVGVGTADESAIPAHEPEPE